MTDSSPPTYLVRAAFAAVLLLLACIGGASELPAGDAHDAVADVEPDAEPDPRLDDDDDDDDDADARLAAAEFDSIAHSAPHGTPRVALPSDESDRLFRPPIA